MVLDADAVVDPGAVVVKAFDTLVADSTVARAGGSDCFAVGAEGRALDCSY